MQNPL